MGGLFKAVFLLTLGMLLCVSSSDDIRNLEVTGAADARLNGIYVARVGVEGRMPEFNNNAERVRSITRIARASWTNRPYYEKDGAAIFFNRRWQLRSPYSNGRELVLRLQKRVRTSPYGGMDRESFF